uniref:EF-hand domain-containing protein n=1 Tax=Tetradesmus obliquus TaxID=3088 RepID=A0A383VCJ3_TETOB|eukprot:jgi/Sobl393_1/9678/SZX62452.1
MGSGYSQLSSQHLTKEQLQRVEQKFKRLSGGDGQASIEDILLLPELAGNPLVPRMFELLDDDGDGFLTLQEFIKAIEWFGTIKTADDMYRLAFTLYDLDADGCISAQELFSMLQQLLGEGVGDQQLERVVQATMLQYDTDGDWRLDFREFVALMNRVDLYGKFTFTVC